MYICEVMCRFESDNLVWSGWKWYRACRYSRWLSHSRVAIKCFVALSDFKNVEPEARLPPFCRRQYEIHVLEWKFLYLHFIALKLVHVIPVSNKRTLVLILLGADQVKSQYLNECWLNLRTSTHIRVSKNENVELRERVNLGTPSLSWEY